MATKKALIKELEALKKELAETKEELATAKHSADTVHLYREHCVTEWFECEKEVKRLTNENTKLRMDLRRLAMAYTVVKSAAERAGLYDVQEINNAVETMLIKEAE